MRPVPDRALLPLPAQPDGVPWPDGAWPEANPTDLGADGARLDALLDELVDGEHPVFGRTYAAAVVAGGRLVAERFGERVVQDLRSLGDDPPYEPVDGTSELLSWSMAKSITSLAVGVAVADGLLDVADRVPEPQWTDPADPRHAITWHDLLAMRPGLAWTEQYHDFTSDALPDVITMLFGEGAADVGAYAASMPLVAEPGSPEAYVYSSGTTNIIAANLQRVLRLDAAGMDRYLRERIFDPLGFTSLRAQYDPAGTFIGSSYVWANLRDWCRFGLLAARGGRWGDRVIVPAAWIDEARTARSRDDEMGLIHGAQWWTWDQDQMPFGAHGFEGQRIIAFPTRDVVVVRFGKTGPNDTAALNAHLTEVASCFPELSA